jgi:flagellar assembly protein FliH
VSLKRLLEEFSPNASQAVSAQASATSFDTHELDLLKKAAFEDGYASGWDDARKAEDAARAHVDAEFERCLHELAFTYHEAVGQIRAEMLPLVDTLLEQFFPKLLPDLLRETVREEILGHAEERLSPSIELQAAVGTTELFEDLLLERTDLQINVREEPSLGPNQAFVRIEKREILVDFEPLLALARSQLDALRVPHDKDFKHG